MIDEELLLCFLDEALDSLNQWERACLDLETNPAKENYGTLFRAAHNIKGASRTVGLEKFGTFVHTVEDLIKLLMDGVLPIDPTLLGCLLEGQVKLVNWVEELRSDANADPDVSEITAKIKGITGDPKAYLVSIGAVPPPPPVEEKPAGSQAKGAVDDLQDVFNAAKAEYDNAAQPASANPAPQAAASVSQPTEAAKPGAPVEAKPAADTKKAAEGAKAQKTDETIRIAANKLDELLQLIGELSIHQAILFQGKREGSLQSRICNNAIHLSNKIVKDLYSKAMSLRMQPIITLFQRLERVARDVARSQNKKIQIVLEGTDVELDKTVIERITDPLIHIIRNAVDHGIETFEERKRTPKNEVATIKLMASQDPAGVCIKVAEDGRGLNRDKILKKAIEKGLVSPAQTLTPDQIHNLIFLPGFSTAEQVSDISGRGVGMDVVTKAVQDLQGNIDIASAIGQGTIFSITLPTSLSIVEALVVKIDEMRYAVAMHELTEIIDLAEYTIDSSGNKGRMISIRGEVVPLQNLNQELKVPVVKKTDQERRGVQHKSHHEDCRPALVVREAGATIAFEVDSILGQQQVVVRPLSEHLSKVPGFSGSMIMGDGEPGMIVSLSDIARAYVKAAEISEYN